MAPALNPSPPEATRAVAGALVRSAVAGAAPVTAPHLLVTSGPRAGFRVALRATLTLGRGRAADVVLPDPEASRVHARVGLGAETVTVEDLGSKNGVRVNGQRVEPGAQALRPGDEVTIGETTLRLEDPLRVLAEPSPAGGRPGSPRAGFGRPPSSPSFGDAERILREVEPARPDPDARAEAGEPGRTSRSPGRGRWGPELAAAALLALSAAALALASFPSTGPG